MFGLFSLFRTSSCKYFYTFLLKMTSNQVLEWLDDEEGDSDCNNILNNSIDINNITSI